MFSFLVMAAAVAIAQFEYSPPETMPRVLQMSDGKVIYAFVEEDWRRRNQQVVRLDDPLRPLSPTRRDTDTIITDKVERDYPEAIHEWRERHEQAWKEAGYVNLGTREQYFYVSETEYELARRAHGMAQGNNVAVVGTSTASSTGDEAPETRESAQAPVFLVLWGRHIFVIVFALASSAAAIWFFVLRE